MKALTLSLAALFSVLVGCAGSEPSSSEQGGDPQQAAASTEPTDTKKTTTPTKDSTPDTNDTAACPDVKGAWSGPIDGLAQAVSSKMDEKVDGSSTLTLIGDGDDLTFDDESIFNAVIHTSVGKVPVKQTVTGKVTCGAFAAHLSTKSGSSNLSGDASCTLTTEGCKGTWSVNENDKLVAKGTFTLARSK